MAGRQDLVFLPAAMNDYDTAPVEIPDPLTDWRNECPLCHDQLYSLEEQAGVMRYQCLGCGREWWHAPGRFMRDTPPKRNHHSSYTPSQHNANPAICEHDGDCESLPELATMRGANLSCPENASNRHDGSGDIAQGTGGECLVAFSEC